MIHPFIISYDLIYIYIHIYIYIYIFTNQYMDFTSTLPSLVFPLHSQAEPPWHWGLRCSRKQRCAHRPCASDRPGHVAFITQRDITHTYMRTYIYIYLCMYVCVCVIYPLRGPLHPFWKLKNYGAVCSRLKKKRWKKIKTEKRCAKDWYDY